MLRVLRFPLRNTGRRDLDQFKAEPLDCVIPAWSAGIQLDMDVSSDASLQTWMPAIHAAHDHEDLVFSCSVGERKIMNHFVVSMIFAQ